MHCHSASSVVLFNCSLEYGLLLPFQLLCSKGMEYCSKYICRVPFIQRRVWRLHYFWSHFDVLNSLWYIIKFSVTWIIVFSNVITHVNFFPRILSIIHKKKLCQQRRSRVSFWCWPRWSLWITLSSVSRHMSYVRRIAPDGRGEN